MKITRSNPQESYYALKTQLTIIYIFIVIDQ